MPKLRRRQLSIAIIKRLFNVRVNIVFSICLSNIGKRIEEIRYWNNNMIDLDNKKTSTYTLHVFTYDYHITLLHISVQSQQQVYSTEKTECVANNIL